MKKKRVQVVMRLVNLSRYEGAVLVMWVLAM